MGGKLGEVGGEGEIVAGKLGGVGAVASTYIKLNGINSRKCILSYTLSGMENTVQNSSNLIVTLLLNRNGTTGRDACYSRIIGTVE